MNSNLKKKLIAIAVFILAIAVLISSINKYLDRSNTSSWKSATGIVLYSGVEERTIYRKQRQNTFSPRSDNVYLQRIEYAYQADGVDYTSKNFNLNPNSGGSLSYLDGTSRPFKTKQRAREEANKYKKGSAIQVYYNPDKPNIATLRQKNASLIPLLFSFGFLGFGVLAVLIAFEQINPENLPWRKKS